MASIKGDSSYLSGKPEWESSGLDRHVLSLIIGHSRHDRNRNNFAALGILVCRHQRDAAQIMRLVTRMAPFVPPTAPGNDLCCIFQQISATTLTQRACMTHSSSRAHSHACRRSCRPSRP